MMPLFLLATMLGVAFIGLGGVNLVFLTVSPKFITTLPMLPNPIPYSESESHCCGKVCPFDILFLDPKYKIALFIVCFQQRRDLFKKSLARSTYGGVIVHIHSLADIASQDQHISRFGIFELDGSKLQVDVRR
jgi:hypothetical protein